MADPLALLKAAAEANPRGLAGVATELGYSRPALSRYVNGSYGDTKRLDAAIVSRYDRRDCPHTGQDIAPDVCRRRALSPKPFGGEARERQWEACQVCIHKPENQEAP